MAVTLPAVSPTLFIFSATSAQSWFPLTMELTVLSMIRVVFWAASADFPARFLTSSATTAKPFPASPALAASTAALSERMFVWNAISSIVLTIFLVSLENWLISFMALTSSDIMALTSWTAVPAAFALSLASAASEELALIDSEIDAIFSESSWIDAACCVAPWARAWAPDETSSVPLKSWSEAWSTFERAAERLSRIYIRLSRISLVSPT